MHRKQGIPVHRSGALCERHEPHITGLVPSRGTKRGQIELISRTLCAYDGEASPSKHSAGQRANQFAETLQPETTANGLRVKELSALPRPALGCRPYQLTLRIMHRRRSPIMAFGMDTGHEKFMGRPVTLCCRLRRRTIDLVLGSFGWSMLPGDTTDCGYRITSNENSKVFIDQLILPIISTFPVPPSPPLSLELNGCQGVSSEMSMSPSLSHGIVFNMAMCI